MNLSAKSQQILNTVHVDMQAVVAAVVAVAPFQIVVMQGMRTAEDEMALWLSCHNPDGTRNGQPWKTNCNGYAPGTTAPNGIEGTGVSNHQSGLAVDLGVMVAGAMVWDLPHYQLLNRYMQGQAMRLDKKIIYGGSFHTPDPDHWELDSESYS